jgi:hypothetical protein
LAERKTANFLIFSISVMKIKRYEAIEIPIPNGSTLTRFYAPDQPQLRSAKIQAIQIYTPTVISKTPLTGSTPATLADIKQATLTLYQGDLQIIFSLPLLAFNNIQDLTSPSVWELPEMNDIDISWTKSYISLATAAGTTNVAFSLGIYYYL